VAYFCNKNDFSAVFVYFTPYKHCLVYHVPFFTKKYGKHLRFSGQGVEKINDDIQKIHHSKTNKWDATVDALQVRKRIERLDPVSIIYNYKQGFEEMI
jgi:hypothetical protein